jgi:voltage-gated sodium channel
VRYSCSLSHPAFLINFESTNEIDRIEIENYEIQCKINVSLVFVCNVFGSWHRLFSFLEVAIFVIFSAEAAIKICACGMTPLSHFNDRWNVFDFTIVVVSLIPLLVDVGQFSGLVAVFRLMRLLRIFKLAKQFKELRIIVEALIKGFSSITFVSLILFLLFYVFAIVGMTIFAASDPRNFGQLHLAFITLFRVLTLAGWSDLMYTNMLGCDLYGYSAYQDECKDPKGFGYIAVIYYIAFIIFGALILLSLFIGVVTTAMDEAEQKEKRDATLATQVEIIKKTQHLLDPTLMTMHRLFQELDVDREDAISYGDMSPIFKSFEKLDPVFSEVLFVELFESADDDFSGVLIFPEFVEFLLSLHQFLLDLGEKKHMKTTTAMGVIESLQSATAYLREAHAAALAASAAAVSAAEAGAAAAVPVDASASDSAVSIRQDTGGSPVSEYVESLYLEDSEQGLLQKIADAKARIAVLQQKKDALLQRPSKMQP